MSFTGNLLVENRHFACIFLHTGLNSYSLQSKCLYRQRTLESTSKCLYSLQLQFHLPVVYTSNLDGSINYRHSLLLLLDLPIIIMVQNVVVVQGEPFVVHTWSILALLGLKSQKVTSKTPVFSTFSIESTLICIIKSDIFINKVVSTPLLNIGSILLKMPFLRGFEYHKGKRSNFFY